MAYSDKVLDHYENPRNVGAFGKEDDGVGTGMVGAPACGDVMKLQIKVNKDGVIEDAKFKTYGCGSAIASSRWSPSGSRARRSTRRWRSRTPQIAEELALPPVKIHCSILAEDAIKAAVADYKKKHGRLIGQARNSTMAVTLSDKAAKHVDRTSSPSAARASACASACAPGCSGMAYKLEFADEVRPGGRRSSKATASRC
jgi:nitrogen fixation NifU-like protein